MTFCGWSSTTCKGSRKRGVGARGILVSRWLWYCFRYHRVRFFGKFAKVCFSKGEFTRHIGTKHHLETAEPKTKVCKMLHPDIFYEIIQISLKMLSQDECYPEEICNQFSNFRMSCSVAYLPASVPYNLVFLFKVGPGIFLCNVGKICAMFARH